MSLLGWLDALTERSGAGHGQLHAKFSKSPRGRRRRPGARRRCSLQVELLEDRSVPSSATALSFQVVASVGDPLPGPGVFPDEFEQGGLNNRGDVAFAADVSTGGQGVFLTRNGQLTEVMRSGETAPGGGVFGVGNLSPLGFNDPGDVAFSYFLDPFSLPLGVNAGAYHYSHATGQITPLVVPFVTPAPGGGKFQGAYFEPSINNQGDIAFPGIIQTDKGIHAPGEDYLGLGIGVFRADAKGAIVSVVSPGDTAPGGGTFDYAAEASMNNRGDVSFEGHIVGDPIREFAPQDFALNAAGGLYVKDGASGEIRTIVRAGDPAPRGGTIHSAFHDVMNNHGDIVFDGDLSEPSDKIQVIGVFLSSGGTVKAMARPGDLMPGGGHFVTTGNGGGQIDVNDKGDVVFNALLDNDVDHDGNPDSGVFQWSQGNLSLIARTGTNIPGVGTVYQVSSTVIVFPPPVINPNGGALNNDRGQVNFTATLTDGRVVNLLATPRGNDREQAQKKSVEQEPDFSQGRPQTNVFTRPGFGFTAEVVDIHTHGAASPGGRTTATKAASTPAAGPLSTATGPHSGAIDAIFATGLEDPLASTIG